METIGKFAYLKGFHELEPVRHLACGIPFYSKQSFPKGYFSVKVEGYPYQPGVIEVDNLVLNMRHKAGHEDLKGIGPKTILAFHGMSTRRTWRQEASPRRDVLEVLAEAEKEVSIDALVVCNPGGFRMKKGGRGYTYPLGIISSYLLMKKGVLAQEVACNGGFAVKPGEVMKDFDWMNGPLRWEDS